MAWMTVVTGIGQSVGPILASWPSDLTGLTLSPVALLFGGVLAFGLPKARL